MEIYIKDFNKKFNVRATNKNMLATYDMQLKLAQAQDMVDKEPIEQIKQSRETQQGVVNYLINTLKLDKKSVEKLNNYLEFEETVDIANHLALRLLGLSEEDIKKTEEEETAKN